MPAGRAASGSGREDGTSRAVSGYHPNTGIVMKAKKTKHKDGMLAKKPSKGLERDNKGRPIPMAKRLAEDRAKAKRAK